MGILKVIEVLSNSNKSWEDATKKPFNKPLKRLKTFAQSMFKTRVQLLAVAKWMNLESI
jgi:hypothetical protein